jgi:hypothetical protein
MDNSNPNFEFNINLSGIRAASGAGLKLPEGFYEGTVTDAFQTTSKNGRPQVAIKVTLKGQFEGTVRTSWMGIPQAEEDGVRYYWRAVFESLGYQSAEIDAGVIGVSRQVLVGRSCSIYYKPGDKDMGIYEELKFLAPHDFAQQKVQFDAASTAPGSALGATSAPAPTATAPAGIGAPLNGGGAPISAGNTLTKDGLMAALNRN